MSLDADLVDIPGVVMENLVRLLIGLATLLCLFKMHSSRGLGWFHYFSVLPLVVWWKSIFMYELVE